MSKTRSAMGLSLLVIVLLVGCDARSTPRKYLIIPITSVAVGADDTLAIEHVIAFDDARIAYARQLKLLEQFYTHRGDVHRTNWADREYENLKDAQSFKWTNIQLSQPMAVDLPEGANESTLVEDLVNARRAYLQALAELEANYIANGLSDDIKAVRSIRERFDPIRTYYYMDAAEYPPLSLQPYHAIAEADQLFDDGLKLYEEGKGWMRTFLSTNYNKQRESLALFRAMIRRYPTSDKIAMAAFYVGEIYKEYFNENVRAVNWYRRAWTWDTHVDASARFQAATVFDHRLENKPKALELYQDVLEHERFNTSNVAYATGRIEVLRRELGMEIDRLTPTPDSPDDVSAEPVEWEAPTDDPYDEYDDGYDEYDDGWDDYESYHEYEDYESYQEPEYEYYEEDEPQPVGGP